jgi:hypothetical protein
VQRTCDACGSDFEAQRSTRKTCSEACKKRAQRGQKVVPISPPSPEEMDFTTVAETRAELESAGRLHGHLAASALRLARRVDESTAVMGYAPLVKELRAVMAEALKGAHKADDAIDGLRDEIAERRARNARGA